MENEPEQDSADEGQTDPTLTTVDLDAVLARRASPRKRLLQATAIVLPLLLAGTLVVHSALPLLAAPPSPTPIPTVALPIIPLTVASNVSFGTLTLNGKVMKGSLPLTVRLKAGVNTLTLDAPPFPRRTCNVRGPILAVSGYDPVVDSSDQSAACGFSMGETGNPGGESTFTADLTVTYSGADLPPDQQAQARAAIETALSALSPPPETVGVGQSYATGVGANGIPTSRRATQPLTASMSYSLFVPDTASVRGDAGMPCASGLCGSGDSWEQHVDANAWKVEVVTGQRWRFTTPGGSTAGAMTLPQASITTFALVYDRASGWQLPAKPLSVFSGIPSEGPGPDSCSVVMQLVQSLLPQGTGAGWQTVPGAADALPTCALNMQNLSGSIQVRFIWRFGVLSAVDAQAHTLAPVLPVAHPDEIVTVTNG